MAHDIFISYDSEDRDRVRALVEVFEAEGWAVWWDRKIPPGRSFADVIYGALDAARCVVAVWSSSSVESKWVRKEAAEAERRDNLVPVMLDDCQIPFQFRDVHAAQLAGYPQKANPGELDELVSSVRQAVARTTAERALDAELEGPSPDTRQPPKRSKRRPGVARKQKGRGGFGRALKMVGVIIVGLGLGRGWWGLSVPFTDPFFAGLVLAPWVGWMAIAWFYPKRPTAFLIAPMVLPGMFYYVLGFYWQFTFAVGLVTGVPTALLARRRRRALGITGGRE